MMHLAGRVSEVGGTVVAAVSAFLLAQIQAGAPAAAPGQVVQQSQPVIVALAAAVLAIVAPRAFDFAKYVYDTKQRRREKVEDRDYRDRIEAMRAELARLRALVNANAVGVAVADAKASVALGDVDGDEPALSVAHPLPTARKSGVIRKPLVLLVEDNDDSATALSRLLPMAGFRVELAPTVARAVELLGHRPEFLVLDLALPDGSGLDVLRRVREAGLPARVFITTGCADEATLAAARALAPERLFVRPITFKDLLAAMTRPAPAADPVP